jgi:hypothetical protein
MLRLSMTMPVADLTYSCKMISDLIQMAERDLHYDRKAVGQFIEVQHLAQLVFEEGLSDALRRGRLLLGLLLLLW